MDPLTQGLLGAATSQALLGKQLGRRAWLIGAVGGVLADADVFIRSEQDPLLEIEVHRGFTHALAFIPAGGAVASLPWLLRKKHRSDWKAVYGGAVAGYATHGLLDACTTYGTQLYWPFSSVRVAWNCISIVDPIFTLVLLLGVAWAAITSRRGPAVLSLVICMLYLSFGVAQRERALGAQDLIAGARGHVPLRQAAFPSIGNLLVWRSLYEASDSLYADRIRVPIVGPPRWRDGSTVLAFVQADLAPALRQNERVVRDFERFRWFSGGWVARAPHDRDIIGDARYSLQTGSFDPVWGVRFDPAAQHPTGWVNRTDAREMRFGPLWREMRGRDPEYRSLP
jgi:inner membrane protein